MIRYLIALTGLFFTSSIVQAQISGKSILSFTTQSGAIIHKGDTVRIGRGSDANGSFRYIFIPSNVFTGTPQKFFTSNLAGSAALIKDLRTTDSGTYGIQTVAVIKGEGLLSGCIVINPAEEAGELRTKSVRRPTAAATTLVTSTNVTDELIKLKQLLDAKVLTPAEFTVQKNRLLKQQVDGVSIKPDNVSGKTQTANDIDSRLISAIGNIKSQTVTVIISFTNKTANKTDFSTRIQSFTSPEGEEFALKTGVLGNNSSSKTLFTDAPIQGTFVFAGIMSKTNTMKVLPVPYGYILPNSKYEQGQVEFRDIFINWK